MTLCAADELTPNRSPEYSAVPIGAAIVDITPDYPVRLTGYGNRMKESDGVAAKIHARALVIGVGPACRAGLPPTGGPGVHSNEHQRLTCVVQPAIPEH
jgi:hypothetical protein